MPCTAGALADMLQGELRGSAEFVINDVRTVHKAGPADLTFAGDEEHLQKLARSAAGAALVSRKLASAVDGLTQLQAVILVDDPLTAAFQAVEQVRPPRARPAIGRSPQALIDPTAVIGENTNIHPGAIIGEGVRIGRNCEIHSHVVIGPGCTIGDDVILYPNVVLYADVALGNRVIAHAGVVIGSDGFGYRFSQGRHQKLPHYGTVRVEDDVEIGSNSTIDRAMFGVTVIGRGTKIDNLVQVAHNVEVGQHNIFAAQVGVAGSVVTGNYVVCAGQAGIADHVKLSDNVTLGAKAAAHKDLEPGRYHGIPVLPETEAIRVFMFSRKLPEMSTQLKQLDKQVKALSAQLAALTSAGASSEDSVKPAA